MSLNAKRMFRRLSGYVDDSTLVSLIDDLNEGQHKEMEVLMESNKFFTNVLEGKENQKELSSFIGNSKKDWVETPFTYSDGTAAYTVGAKALVKASKQFVKLDRSYWYVTNDIIAPEIGNPYAEPTRTLYKRIPMIKGDDVKWLQ